MMQWKTTLAPRVGWPQVAMLGALSFWLFSRPGLAVWQMTDAQLNWPGFFIFNAFLTQIAGPQSGSLLTAWTVAGFNLLYLAPLLMLLNAATNDQRLVWLGVWFYYLTSWIGQGYFAPQAFSYFLYLVISAILLQWFKVEQPGLHWMERAALAPTWFGRQVRRLYLWSIEPALPITLPQGSQSGLIAFVVALFAVIVSSHPLTPFVILVGVSLLVLLKRCRLRNLPLLMAIMLLAWLAYRPTDFLSGPLRNLLNTPSNLSFNVPNQTQDSAQPTVMLYLRLGLALLVWGLALLGGLRRLRQGHSDVSFILLMLAPFILLGWQGDRDAMLMRIYFFNLPFAAFFAAALFYPTPAASAAERLASIITEEHRERDNAIKPWLWPLIITGSAIMVASVTFSPVLSNLSATLRLCVTLWFLLICPGMAFVRLLRLPSARSEWTLAIALSLALNTLVAEFMLYTQRWSPESMLALLLSLSLIGVLLQLLLRRQPPLPALSEPAASANASERNVL
ncbi:MAG: hypothetical protein U0350_01235 [Caldilineaceae bacterium]